MTSAYPAKRHITGAICIRYLDVTKKRMIESAYEKTNPYRRKYFLHSRSEKIIPKSPRATIVQKFTKSSRSAEYFARTMSQLSICGTSYPLKNIAVFRRRSFISSPGAS